MRRIQSYVKKYGPEVGPKLYRALQSQAAHAGVSARLRRKIDALSGLAPRGAELPLFPEEAGARHQPEPAAFGA